MAQHTDVFDLGRLGLASGEGRSIDLHVRVGEFQFGGQTYTAAEVPARLDVSRMPGGYALRVRFSDLLAGPCMRCLEDATHGVTIDAREIHQPGGGSDELSSPYMEGDELDLQGWARDALVLELPTQIVCSDDCKGLCAVCGENLNRASPDHHHEKPRDSRWSKLSELTFE